MSEISQKYPVDTIEISHRNTIETKISHRNTIETVDTIETKHRNIQWIQYARMCHAYCFD